jgi:cytochrome c oxidase subunit 3
MFFAGFTSAMVFRRGGAKDWKPVPLPDIIWTNTAVLAVSSVLAEKARRGLRNGDRARFSMTWSAATLMGCGFVWGQVLLWRQLKEAGVYMAANPSGAFFYVGTIAHVVHLAGGLGAMLYLCYRAWRLQLGPGRRTAVDVTAIYWHFLGGLWIYLVALFWFLAR